ncbi:MAG: kinase-like domain-containing protein [Benjaminiella poitrasii]|nr:MAG: kinase-like domain-containing protein [Benjaminiella poitrasii]
MSRTPVTVPCKYKTGRVLGNGTYATVKGKYYAVKIINKKLMEGREHMIRNEINILKRISQGNKNILSLVDYFETLNNLYLVTDLASGGELFDRICEKGSYFEKDAAKIVQTMCSAVAYLHDNGIVHRGIFIFYIYPENLLFRTKEEDSDLLIADFGLSRIIDTDRFHTLKTTCGTPGYMAPEIFKKTGHGKPVDMWAIGVITYFLLSGYTPFEGANNIEEMNAIMNADYNYDDPCWENISQTAKNFIDRCLTIDVNDRITAHEALEHQWLTSGTADDDQAKTTDDLLPNLRTNFNARRTFKRAINLVALSNHFGHSLGKNSSSGASSTSTNIADEIKPVNEGLDQVLESA